MLILFDNGTPAPLRYALKGHVVTDKNIRYQQNLKGRKIAFVVIGNQQWPTLRRYVDRVVAAVNAATQGSFAEVEIPFE